jgi:hypothetical protein
MSSILTNSTLPPGNRTGVITAPGGVVSDADRVSQADLDSDVFNTPVEALINLWVTRYGNAWVDIADVMDDRFYGRVFKRLRSLSELEVHYLTDRARYVCRRHE